MSDSTSNSPTRFSNTVNMGEGVSNLTDRISKLEAAEDRTCDMISRISSLLNDILEPQSHNVSEKQRVSAKHNNGEKQKVSEKQKISEKQKVSEKQIQLTASIISLNNIREQSRYGYSVLYALWTQWGDVHGEGENEEIGGQVRKLNRTHERNRQGIVALWRKVRDLQREEEKLVGRQAGKGTSGVAWGHALRVFSGMDSDM